MAEIAPWDEAKQAQSATPARIFPTTGSDTSARPPWDEARQGNVAAPPQPGGAFYGAASMLPTGIQQRLPSFLTGPSVGEQLAGERQAVTEAESKAGHPLGLAERLKVEPATASPVAMGFATHQTGELGGVVASGNAAAAENFIRRAYRRAVKPGVGTAGSGVARDAHYESMRDAVSSIVENKPNLEFTDHFGNVARGRLPQSLDEFSDAIDQTKERIFKKYDTMAQQAQQGGIYVPLVHAADELENIARDRVTAVQSPEVGKYAQELADRYRGQSFFSPSETQRAIKMLNESLKAFYKNPSMETASRAAVEAKLASLLREELDSAIRYGVAPGYQELKNQYGSLKAIEKEVASRAQVVGRQEPGGGLLGRFADVAVIGEFLTGLATLNPSMMLSAVGLKGAAEYLKYQRGPNLAISKLFDAAEKQTAPARSPIVPNIPLSPLLPNNQGANAMGLQPQ